MDHSNHGSKATNAPQNESLLDLLERRYASDEITLAQFEEMKRVLELKEGGTLTMSGDAHTHH